MISFPQMFEKPRCSGAFDSSSGFREARHVCSQRIHGDSLDQKHFGPARGKHEPGGGYA
jgi:hypothetical protein